jgi:phosphate transport system substrate-binding protein
LPCLDFGYVHSRIRHSQSPLASAQLPPDMIVWVSDPEAPDAYPIVTFTWLEAIKGLVDYSLTDGQKDSESLGYIPLPAAIATKVKAAADSI